MFFNTSNFGIRHSAYLPTWSFERKLRTFLFFEVNLFWCLKMKYLLFNYFWRPFSLISCCRSHVCMSQNTLNIITLFVSFSTIRSYSDFSNALLLTLNYRFRFNFHSMASSGDSGPPTNLPSFGIIRDDILSPIGSPMLEPVVDSSSAAVSTINPTGVQW